MKPKEDPADKKARLRERRMSELELQQSAQQNARGLATDLFSVYGMTRGAPGNVTGPRIGGASGSGFNGAASSLGSLFQGNAKADR